MQYSNQLVACLHPNITIIAHNHQIATDIGTAVVSCRSPFKCAMGLQDCKQKHLHLIRQKQTNKWKDSQSASDDWLKVYMIILWRNRGIKLFLPEMFLSFFTHLFLFWFFYCFRLLFSYRWNTIINFFPPKMLFSFLNIYFCIYYWIVFIFTLFL